MNIENAPLVFADEEPIALATEAVAAFIRRHAEGLWTLMERAPDPTGIDAVGDLISISEDPLLNAERVATMLHKVRDSLMSLPDCVIDEIGSARSYPDLHATFRWYLARLDDLIAAMK